MPKDSCLPAYNHLFDELPGKRAGSLDKHVSSETGGDPSVLRQVHAYGDSHLAGAGGDIGRSDRDRRRSDERSIQRVSSTGFRQASRCPRNHTATRTLIGGVAHAPSNHEDTRKLDRAKYEHEYDRTHDREFDRDGPPA